VGKISRIRLAADGKRKKAELGVEEQELAVLLPQPPPAGRKESGKAAKTKSGRPGKRAKA
jgi:hypothetical protein